MSAETRSRSGTCRPGSGHSSSQRSSYEERCVDPEEDKRLTPQLNAVHECLVKDTNRKTSETPETTQSCSPCTSLRSCRRSMCSVLTCGLSRLCQRPSLTPRLVSNRSAAGGPEKVSLQSVDPEDDKDKQDQTLWLGDDVHIAGVKVETVRERFSDSETKALLYERQPGGQTQYCGPPVHASLRFDDWEDDGEEEDEDVDSLITKKLLELYSEYQIEELARCASDSAFLRKSAAVDQLITSLAEEHKMDEQEAECRLVRGIIRISTRRSRRRRTERTERTERTLSDSGNETMRDSDSFSCNNNNDYKSNPNIQISELTSSDKCARDMWRNNGGPCSPTSFSSSHTETNSSGVSLLQSSVKQ